MGVARITCYNREGVWTHHIGAVRAEGAEKMARSLTADGHYRVVVRYESGDEREFTFASR